MYLFDRKDEPVSQEQKLFYVMDVKDRAFFLRTEIRECANVNPFLFKIVHDHNKETLWKLLQEAKKEHRASPGESTLGGKFFKVCATFTYVTRKVHELTALQLTDLLIWMA